MSDDFYGAVLTALNAGVDEVVPDGNTLEIRCKDGHTLRVVPAQATTTGLALDVQLTKYMADVLMNP